MDGVLLVNKPAGWTSHDVVAKVRTELKKQTGQKVKVGHSGTLDPFATGLLVLLIGRYTKKASEFTKLDKTYEAQITLGSTSTTGDIDGEITPKGSKIPTKAALEAVLRGFIGEIEQIPHRYSALKINGQRAYKLAREGRTIELKPRTVKIYSLKLVDYSYPKVKILIEVSSGTYIRSLAEDIGRKLDTGAYLSSLCRTEVGPYKLSDATMINQLPNSSKSARIRLTK